ncbi:hypothetical protein LO762_01040 [Actinocorallia sp. API 0066]|uniref:hypothetical protein n=1 Tax=Actinocorallia sp. API 0066 TaxID=2896846 RepID=UPI001E5EBE19|nr:hypothetical protein [Actinocorallia sp. API 0066]MCD0447786.1 hypothetical protein [Actinocorallia sp. API 0066]
MTPPRSPLEQSLTRSLHTHAESAPTPPPTLATQAQQTWHHRRRRRLAALSAATAAAVVLGTFGALHRDGPEPAPTVLTPAPAVPLDELWPDAVHRVPRTLPDGVRITPLAMLDRHTVVAASWAPVPDDWGGEGVTQPKALYAYDIRTRKATKVTDFHQPKRHSTTSSRIVAGDGYVAWQADHWDTDDSVVFARPVTPGPPEHRWKVSGSPHSLTLVNGRAIWASGRDAPPALSAAALADGSVRVHRGGVREIVLGWPWVTEADIPSHGDAAGRPFFGQRIRNVETGEVRGTALTAPASAGAACGVVWCSLGADMVRRDGSARLVGATAHHPTGSSGTEEHTEYTYGGTLPEADHFLVLRPTGPDDPEEVRDRLRIIDLETGRVGEAVVPLAEYVYNSPDSDTIVYRTGEGFTVIDLAALR